MNVLKNPFAIQNGKIILIEDLSEQERGSECNCICPNCNGDFIARMGEKRVHHFAHDKNPCDIVLAYTSGLYMLIHQVLSSGNPFYVPALIVSYSIPEYGGLTEDNISEHCCIIPEHDISKYTYEVSLGKTVVFDDAKIVNDTKGNIEAIELIVSNSKMAIKVRPPDTVCKSSPHVKQHKDMATLELDFSRDEDIIQSSNSDIFSNYLLTDALKKRWVSNPRVKDAYPKILEKAKDIYEKRQEAIKQQEEKRRIAIQQAEQRRLKEREEKAIKEREIVIRRNINKTTPPKDQRVKCDICGELKPSSEFFAGMYIKKCAQCRQNKKQ